MQIEDCFIKDIFLSEISLLLSEISFIMKMSAEATKLLLQNFMSVTSFALEIYDGYLIEPLTAESHGSF